VNIPCENARRLVPAYLDGEVSEEQAGPLRQHLLDCHACREVAKEGRSLARWFVTSEAAAVPQGFAAHVARRAFAGDPGLDVPSDPQPAVAARGSLLPFVLALTSAAAVVLFVLSFAIHSRSLPERDVLRADDVLIEAILQQDPAAADEADPIEVDDTDEAPR
jgi:anti-sigma factor RsiW